MKLNCAKWLNKDLKTTGFVAHSDVRIIMSVIFAHVGDLFYVKNR